MSKSLILPSLICVILIQLSQAKEANITKTHESTGPNTAIIYIPSKFLEVTIKDNILHVDNTFNQSNNNIKPCHITIDPFEDRIIGQIQAIGFMQSIIVWGIRNIDIIDEVKYTVYTMLLVNPDKCTYRPLELPSDEVPMIQPSLPPRVLVTPGSSYPHEFLVFYQTLEKCAPCKYNPKDLRITFMDKQLRAPSEESSKSLHIRPFLEKDERVNNGYVLAYNYDIGTTRVEYLDTNFDILETSYLNHPVDATSAVLRGKHRQNVAVCWQEGLDNITCERLDSRLYSTIRYHVCGYSISLLFDIHGNGFITTVSKSGQVMLYIYNVFGELKDLLIVGTVSKINHKVEIQGYFDYYDSRPYEYCIVVTETPKVENTSVKYFIKCINIQEYTEE